MKKFIFEFEEFNQVKQSYRLELMEQFLQRFSKYRLEKMKQRKVTFNLFNLININYDEVRHTKIFAWLFDEFGSHGQGNLFFRLFIKQCISNFPDKNPSGYIVRKEFSGLHSIIDIMICKQNKYIIYLENKVHSSEGNSQLVREISDLHLFGKSLKIPECRQFAVFLTPSGRNPITSDSKDWISISYKQIIKILNSMLSNIHNNKLKYFLNDWVNTIKKF